MATTAQLAPRHAEAVAPAQRLHYRPEIDGLRAVAVIAVIINHFDRDWLPSGHLGVDIFFVISGFVILRSLLDERPGSLWQFLTNFYVRRVKRLAPALVLFVLVCTLALYLVSPTPGASLRTGIASIFGVSNIELFWQATDYFAPSTQYNAFLHTWSLGVEEQFYLVFPLVVYLTALRIPDRRLLLAVMIALTAASLLYYVRLYRSDPIAAFYLMPARFWELGLGAITCVVVLAKPDVRLLVTPVLPLILVIAALFAPSQYVVPATLLVAVATAVLIFALSRSSPRDLTYKVLTLPTIVFIGVISYSLYLWHWGVLSVGRWFFPGTAWSNLLLAGIMTAAAILSYRYVERPLRHAVWGKRAVIFGACFGAVSAVVLVWFAAPIKASFAQIASRINPSKLPPQPLNQVFLPCHLPKQDDPIAACLAPIDRSKRTIYVIGDSHASNHVPSVESAAASFGNVETRYVIEWGFISTLTGAKKCSDHSSRPCMEGSFDKHLSFFADTLKPGDIVIFAWARDRIVYEGRLPREANNFSLDVLRKGLVALGDVIAAKGAHLVLVDDFPKPCNNTVDWYMIHIQGRHELCSAPISISRQDRQPLTDLFKSLSSNSIHYFDPHDFLCSRETCGIYDEATGSLMYSDNSPHFVPAHSRRLVEQWKSFLSAILSRPA